VYHSFPRLCCSFAERPSKVGVAYHNAAYQALGLDYTYVALAVQDVPAAIKAVNTIVRPRRN
jgi:shikimate dehydrogenase